MKTMKNLVATYQDKKLGNHRVQVYKHIKGIRNFYYYSTVICSVNDNTKEFHIDDSYGSVSTKRACNAYRFELKQMGYTELAS